MLDFSSDFADVVDALETVTLRRAGTMDDQTITGALRRRADLKPSPGGKDRVIEGDVTWHLPNEQLSSPPRLGDAIIDAAAQSWTIIELQYAAITARWQCRARNLDITSGLDQLISIQRATWSKDAHGAPLAEYHEVHSGVAASIQPVGEAQKLIADRRFNLATVRVLLAEVIAIDLDDLVIDSDENAFRVIAVRPPNQLAAPLILEAEPAWPSD